MYFLFGIDGDHFAVDGCFSLCNNTMKLFNKPKTSPTESSDDAMAKRQGRMLKTLFGVKKGSQQTDDYNDGLECTSTASYNIMKEEDAQEVNNSIQYKTEQSEEETEIGNAISTSQSESSQIDNDMGIENSASDVTDTSIATEEGGNTTTKKKKRRVVKKLLRSMSSVLPKVEPLPWGTFFALSSWCAIP